MQNKDDIVNFFKYLFIFLYIFVYFFFYIRMYLFLYISYACLFTHYLLKYVFILQIIALF